MAYDPYDRGDNPWRSNFGVPSMDMPRSNPKAKPGAGRASAAAPPAKKAKPKVPLPPRRPAGVGGASGQGPEATAEILSNEGEHDYATGKPLPRAYTLDPERFSTPLRTTGPEIAITPDERNVPPPIDPAVTGGILGGPPPGMRVPERAIPTGPAAPAPMPFAASPAGNPALQPTQSTGVDNAGMAFLNFLRSQLFNQGRPVT